MYDLYQPVDAPLFRIPTDTAWFLDQLKPVVEAYSGPAGTRWFYALEQK